MYCQPAWKAWSCHPEVLSCRLQPNTLLSAAHLMTQEEQGRCANVSKLLPKQREVLVPTVTICFGALAGCTLYHHGQGAWSHKACQEQHVIENCPYLGHTQEGVYRFCECLSCRWLPTSVHTWIRTDIQQWGQVIVLQGAF